MRIEAVGVNAFALLFGICAHEEKILVLWGILCGACSDQRKKEQPQQVAAAGDGHGVYQSAFERLAQGGRNWRRNLRFGPPCGRSRLVGQPETIQKRAPRKLPQKSLGRSQVAFAASSLCDRIAFA